jgi:hypothetical protein
MVANADVSVRRLAAGLLIACVLLLALTGLVGRDMKGTRALACGFAILMLFNAAGHTLTTIFGRTVASVTFPQACAAILVVTFYGGRSHLPAGAIAPVTRKASAQGWATDSDFCVSSSKIEYWLLSPQPVPRFECWRALAPLRRAFTTPS